MSGAPYLRKFGKPIELKKLVLTSAYAHPPVHGGSPKAKFVGRCSLYKSNETRGKRARQNFLPKCALKLCIFVKL